ncbi:MAG: glycosyltransferase [Holophagaceae bacterium]|nr:glycosyltransferase [Holophagaceae bacterium]
MAGGLPVITTSNAGALDLIVHGQNGLIVLILDADALAEAMTRLAEDPEELHRMRLQAFDAARRWQWRDFRVALVEALEANLHG